MDSRLLTPSSVITDIPIVFYNEDGTPYLPLNFRGEWKGSVLLFDALTQSMNVPSLMVLDTIGFDAAINRAAALMGYTNPDEIQRRFPRVYPLGLGINTTSPLRMAQAYAVFANQGRQVTPIAIRSIEDRNGRIVMQPEQDLRQNQRRMGNSIQIISPQNAYVMSSMLKKTLENGPNGWGTLYNPAGWGSKFTFVDEAGNRFRMPMAGKTGTPQNWSDAWTIGYSAYYTTAVWFGFDKPGNSLGVNLTGSTLAGPVWADYMREIHQGLPYRDFVRPATGVIDITVCAKSGLLKTSACNEGEVTLTFLEGTQPIKPCALHGNTGDKETIIATTYVPDTMIMNDRSLINSLPLPTLPAEFLYGSPTNTGRLTTTTTPTTTTPNTGTTSTSGNTQPLPPEEDEFADTSSIYGLDIPAYNPLLD
jgi:penicillin-binding protein 1A